MRGKQSTSIPTNLGVVLTRHGHLHGCGLSLMSRVNMGAGSEPDGQGPLNSSRPGAWTGAQAPRAGPLWPPPGAAVTTGVVMKERQSTPPPPLPPNPHDRLHPPTSYHAVSSHRRGKRGSLAHHAVPPRWCKKPHSGHISSREPGGGSLQQWTKVKQGFLCIKVVVELKCCLAYWSNMTQCSQPIAQCGQDNCQRKCQSMFSQPHGGKGKQTAGRRMIQGSSRAVLRRQEGTSAMPEPSHANPVIPVMRPGTYEMIMTL
ncbi:unnamed protein product [Boreogadus saida]